jgi:hypothetical protein
MTMHPVIQTIPILIVYTAVFVYYAKMSLVPAFETPERPRIAIFIGLVLVAYTLYGMGLSFYAGFTQCGKYKILNMISSGLTLSFWAIVAALLLFWFVGLSTPFFTIWGVNQKSEIIAHVFFISLFCILASTVAYFNTKVEVCGPDAQQIEENTKVLDDELNK